MTDSDLVLRAEQTCYAVRSSLCEEPSLRHDRTKAGD